MSARDWADALTDRITELLNDHPDGYAGPPIVQEFTTSASGAVRSRGVVSVDVEGEDGIVHHLTVRVDPA